MKKLLAWSPCSLPLVGFRSRNCFRHLSLSSLDSLNSESGTSHTSSPKRPEGAESTGPKGAESAGVSVGRGQGLG